MLWLVTGCSSGLGLSIANAALTAGHDVIASSRNPSKQPEVVKDFEARGGKWITLDVAGVDAESIIAKAISEHGPIDVLVNNAGGALAGPLESEDLATARALIETNLFGTLRAMQAVIPSMRERKAGTIVNISSSEAWEPHPLLSVYAASKHAVEGLTEAVAGELAPFNIRALLVEPDAIRTSFSDPAGHDFEKFGVRMAPYQGTFLEQVMKFLMNLHGSESVDPDKAAMAIVQEVSVPSTSPPLTRLLIGKESTKKLWARIEMYKHLAEATEGIAASADFE
jgi:NAD(P)-dependent dehydrogenase (short-subunit alcohol dehydrogenase family)